MADRLADWVALVDACYPEREAEGWDQVGLHVGDPDDAVTGVLLALDVTDATLAEAARVGADLLLVHHPLLFRPLPRLTPATASGRLALRAARQGVAVLAAHTNLDVAEVGTTNPIVDALDLVDVRPLAPRAPADTVKLITFVPTDATGAVLAAMGDAGAGVMGEYDHCSFRVRGTGAFRASADADPTVGRPGEYTEVTEDRVEVVLPRDRLRAVVAALREAHPYEEVAFDAIPLVADPTAPVHKGIGRIGALPAPTPLRAVARRLAEALPSPFLRLAGDPDRQVTRVAACGGAGESLLPAAMAAGAEVYVTGDLRHHVALDAVTQGLALVDAGHYATEAAVLPAVRRRLEEAARERGLQARLLASAVRTEPWAAWEEGSP